MWKTLRIALLLIVLVVVALTTWLDRATTTSWQRELWAGVFPVNADDSATAAAHIEALRPEQLEELETFFAREARGYGVALREPIRLRLYPRQAAPPPPLAGDAGPLVTAWWSLRLRWYAFRVTRSLQSAAPQVRIFVLFHDPQRSPRVPHSLGLVKGLIGVVHAFADARMRGSNDIVIAHELLHTLGASDKYDAASGRPRYPDGYAEPQRVPLHPQAHAEVMAGRLALDETRSEMPDELAQVVVGPLTAREIGWAR